MTLWEILTNKQPAVVKIAKAYEFGSPLLIETFTKMAADLGCTTEEIEQQLDLLDERYKTERE